MTNKPNQPAVEPAKSRIVRADSPARIAPLFRSTRIQSRERVEAVELRAKAESELERALKEVAAIREDAFEAGHAESKKQLVAMIAQLQDEAARIRATAATEIQRLAMRFARSLVDADLTVAPDRILFLIKRTLANARFHEKVTLRLNPADVKWVEPQAAALAEMVSSTTAIEILADEAIPIHAVRVESERGTLSLSSATYFEELTRALLGDAPSDQERERT